MRNGAVPGLGVHNKDAAVGARGFEFAEMMRSISCVVDVYWKELDKGSKIRGYEFSRQRADGNFGPAQHSLCCEFWVEIEMTVWG